jgi:hypothetical protein
MAQVSGVSKIEGAPLLAVFEKWGDSLGRSGLDVSTYAVTT